LRLLHFLQAVALLTGAAHAAARPAQRARSLNAAGLLLGAALLLSATGIN